MKLIIFLIAGLISANLFAVDSDETQCHAFIIEKNKKKEVFNFKFECDNYGDGATFTSKSGRYTVIAFSEESCTPQLMIHDKETKITVRNIPEHKEIGDFSIFNDQLITVDLVTNVSLKDILDEARLGAETTIKLGCSSNAELLEAFKAE